LPRIKKTCTFNNSIDCIVIDTSEQALPFCSLGYGRTILQPSKTTSNSNQLTTSLRRTKNY